MEKYTVNKRYLVTVLFWPLTSDKWCRESTLVIPFEITEILSGANYDQAQESAKTDGWGGLLG